MKKRVKMTRKGSQRLFKKGAKRVHKKNAMTVLRGGIRL